VRNIEGREKVTNIEGGNIERGREVTSNIPTL
jgi:hypothetical protein